MVLRLKLRKPDIEKLGRVLWEKLGEVEAYNPCAFGKTSIGARHTFT